MRGLKLIHVGKRVPGILFLFRWHKIPQWYLKLYHTLPCPCQSNLWAAYYLYLHQSMEAWEYFFYISYCGDTVTRVFTHWGIVTPYGRRRSGSPLAQVLACCLTAPSHFMNQCWLIISKVKWHSSKGQLHQRYLSHQSLKLSGKGSD